jgi:c-di-GMP-related signal transduction protein
VVVVVGSAEKGKNILIKHDVTRDVDTVRRNMQAFVPFVNSTIPKKHALLRPKLKLMFIIGSKMRPTRTSKNFQESIIWSFIK